MTVIHPRCDWADFAVRPKSWADGAPAGVILHYSGAGNNNAKPFGRELGPDAMRALYDFGMNRDGAGTEYNDVYFPRSGDCWEGFGPTVCGAHCSTRDNRGLVLSRSWYGICCWGGPELVVDDRLVQDVADVIRDRIAAGWIKPNPTIRGHRDFAATPCPGDAWYHRLSDLMAAVAGAVQDRPTLNEKTEPPSLIRQQNGDNDVLYVLAPHDANARFLGVGSGGFVPVVEWADSNTYAVYSCQAQELPCSAADLRGCTLLGALPTNDNRRTWQASDFRQHIPAVG